MDSLLPPYLLSAWILFPRCMGTSDTHHPHHHTYLDTLMYRIIVQQNLIVFKKILFLNIFFTYINENNLLQKLIFQLINEKNAYLKDY